MSTPQTRTDDAPSDPPQPPIPEWLEQLIASASEHFEALPPIIMWRAVFTDFWTVEMFPAASRDVKGMTIYPFAAVDLGEVFDLFDAPPDARWRADDGAIDASGHVDGEDLFLILKQCAPEEAEPQSQMTADGGWTEGPQNDAVRLAPQVGLVVNSKGGES